MQNLFPAQVPSLPTEKVSQQQMYRQVVAVHYVFIHLQAVLVVFLWLQEEDPFFWRDSIAILQSMEVGMADALQ